MPPLKLSDRERNLALVTLGFAVFYVFYQFLLTPKGDEIGRLKEKARGQRLELKIAEGKIKILEAIEKAAGAIPGKPPAGRQEKALEVLRNISLATTKSGLNLASIKPMLEPGKEELKFTLSCSGKYKNLYDFLVILHGLRMLVLVDAIDVSGGGSAEPVLNIQMALTAYF